MCGCMYECLHVCVCIYAICMLRSVCSMHISVCACMSTYMSTYLCMHVCQHTCVVGVNINTTGMNTFLLPMEFYILVGKYLHYSTFDDVFMLHH